MKYKELKQIIRIDKSLYKEKSVFNRIYRRFTLSNKNDFLNVIIVSRKYNFYKKYYESSIIYKILFLLYSRKLNKLSKKNNIEIYGNFGKNLKIYHRNIVINNNAKIGNNVIFHGNNCIGNNGKNNKAPKIGNNVEIGYGTTIIGDISIADNVKIGANSLVNKSILTEGVTACGIPAKVVSNGGKK